MALLSTGVHADSSDNALRSLPAQARVFGLRDHAALWFSLGVGLLVMQMGAFLVPALGAADALLAIVVGSVLGAGLLAWSASIGAERGVGSAGLMHHTLGPGFARLPVVLNIVQLIGWGAFELVIMREGSLAIVLHTFPGVPQGWEANLVTTLAWGGVLVLLLRVPMTGLVRTTVRRYGLPLVVLSLVWLSWQFGAKVQEGGWAAFWDRRGDGSLGMFQAIDLVIAMPLSWLALVADYARFGTSKRGAFWGTWVGYTVANMWCYALGVLVASVAEPGAPLVGTLLLAQGGLVALGLILVDEMDNAYGDVYSAGVSSSSLFSKISLRTAGVVLALVCTVLALFLPLHDLEPFLLLLSSVFVPLYGVILGRLGLGATPAQAPHTQADAGPSGQAQVTAAGIWLLGVGLFHVLVQWGPQWGLQWGATLPTLLCTGVAAYASRKR